MIGRIIFHFGKANGWNFLGKRNFVPVFCIGIGIEKYYEIGIEINIENENGVFQAKSVYFAKYRVG